MKTDVKWPNLTRARCVCVPHILPDASLRVCVAHIDTPGTLLFRGIIDAKIPGKDTLGSFVRASFAPPQSVRPGRGLAEKSHTYLQKLIAQSIVVWHKPGVSLPPQRTPSFV